LQPYSGSVFPHLTPKVKQSFCLTPVLYYDTSSPWFITPFAAAVNESE